MKNNISLIIKGKIRPTQVVLQFDWAVKNLIDYCPHPVKASQGQGHSLILAWFLVLVRFNLMVPVDVEDYK